MIENFDKLLSSVEEALEINGMRHFIHKETFELLSYPDNENSIYADMELFEDAMAEVAENNKYVEIEPISSREGYIIMEDFTDTVHNMSKVEVLMRSLNRPNPFRQFRYALEDTGLLDSWYAYKNKAYRELAEKWSNWFLEKEKIGTAE